MNRPVPFRWRLGEILIQKGWLSRKRLDQALATQEKNGLIIGSVLSEDGHASQEKIYRALAIQHRIPFVDLNHFTIGPEAILAFPYNLAYHHQVMPLAKAKNRLMIAVSDPKIRQLSSFLCSVVQVENIEIVMASPKAIQKMIENYYGAKQRAA